ERVAALMQDDQARHAAVLAVRAGRHAVGGASHRGAARLTAFQQATEELLEATLSLHLRGDSGRSDWSGRARELAALLRADTTAPTPRADQRTGRDPGFSEPDGHDRPEAALARDRVEAALDAIASALSRPDRRAAPIAEDPRRLRAAFGAHSLVPPTALRIAVAIAMAVA